MPRFRRGNHHKARALSARRANVPGSGTGVNLMVSRGALARSSREPKRRMLVGLSSDSLRISQPKVACRVIEPGLHIGDEIGR